MKTRTGNLAALTGRVIILHGVNGGWRHGPKFGAGFAADIAARDEGARESYLNACQHGRGDDARPRIYADEHPALAGVASFNGRYGGLPLGWVFPHRLPDGAWLLHGVIQPWVRGTPMPMTAKAAGLLDSRGLLREAAEDTTGRQWAKGSKPAGPCRFMAPDRRPAKGWAVRAVLENAVRFMRKRALAEGKPYELHCTRLGCGLGGLEWPEVRRRIEDVERYMNGPIPDPRLVAAEVREGRRFRAEFTVWGRKAEELAA